VFRLFLRLDGVQPDDGLGLAIALDIARLHGGDISPATARPGFRATVRVPV
jgi:two-component system osmolarity sensor histidine kinase EnvZ